MSEYHKPNQPAPAVAMLMGVAGQGFLMLAKDRNWHLPEPIVWIIGGLSVIGLIIGGIVYARWFLLWVKAHLNDRKPNADARQKLLVHALIGAVALAGVILVGVAITATVLYRNGYFDPPPPQIVAVPQSFPQSRSSTQSAQPLVAPEPPPIPKETADQIARYMVLMDLDQKAENAKQALAASVEPYLANMRPRKPGTISTYGNRYVYRNYELALSRLHECNKQFYANRPLDLESAPDMSNPLKTAPGEDEFGDDKDAQYKYRVVYFQTINIVRQSEKLAADIKVELQRYKATILSTPYAKFLE